MTLQDPSHRCGRVVLIGRPNVGKSTLLNALIGERLSIVSPKPQTTRHSILGVATREGAQIVFVDTPGLHAAGGRALNRHVNRVARQAPEEADLIVHVADARRWTDEDEAVWRLAAAHAAPKLLVLNKVDLVPDKGRLLPFAAELTRTRDYAGVHFLCARRQDGLAALLDDIAGRLPEGPPAFGEDELTDRSERFLAAELIREQLMLQLSAELPYATTVEIERFEDEGSMARIAAAIWVERDGQKAIVVGKAGERLKAIGTAARLRMEKLFGRKVFLQLWVKVRENWSDDEAALRRLGYDG